MTADETPAVHPHEHDFGDPNSVPFGTVRWCQWRTAGVTDSQCQEVRVAWRDRVPSVKHWRKLTAEETLTLTARMWEDLITYGALSIIHGRERARQKMGIS